MEIITKSPEETYNLGYKIANRLLKKARNKALVVALVGDLGSGKTTFTQGFARGLGVSKRIISPTFILQRSYQITNKDGKKSSKRQFYHVDLYRLETEVRQELENLGFFDLLDDPRNLVLIEWADRAGKLMPKGTTWINFDYTEGDKRKIDIRY